MRVRWWVANLHHHPSRPFPFPLLPFPPPWPTKGPPRRNPESRLTRDPCKGRTGRFADQCNRVMPPKKCRCPSPRVPLSPARLQRVSCRSCFLALQKAPYACTPPILEIYGALGETKPTCSYAYLVLRTYTHPRIRRSKEEGERTPTGRNLIYSHFPSFPCLFLLICSIYLFSQCPGIVIPQRPSCIYDLVHALSRLVASDGVRQLLNPWYRAALASIGLSR